MWKKYVSFSSGLVLSIVFIIFFYYEKINWEALAVLIIVSGLFPMLLYNFDNVEELLLQRGQNKALIKIKKIKKIKKDIYAKKKEIEEIREEIKEIQNEVGEVIESISAILKFNLDKLRWHPDRNTDGLMDLQMHNLDRLSDRIHELRITRFSKE